MLFANCNPLKALQNQLVFITCAVDWHESIATTSVKQQMAYCLLCCRQLICSADADNVSEADINHQKTVQKQDFRSKPLRTLGKTRAPGSRGSSSGSTRFLRPRFRLRAGSAVAIATNCCLPLLLATRLPDGAATTRGAPVGARWPAPRGSSSMPHLGAAFGRAPFATECRAFILLLTLTEHACPLLVKRHFGLRFLLVLLHHRAQYNYCDSIK